jgi:hypothetical protein
LRSGCSSAARSGRLTATERSGSTAPCFFTWRECAHLGQPAPFTTRLSTVACHSCRQSLQRHHAFRCEAAATAPPSSSPFRCSWSSAARSGRTRASDRHPGTGRMLPPASLGGVPKPFWPSRACAWRRRPALTSREHVGVLCSSRNASRYSASVHPCPTRRWVPPTFRSHRPQRWQQTRPPAAGVKRCSGPGDEMSCA